MAVLKEEDNKLDVHQIAVYNVYKYLDSRLFIKSVLVTQRIIVHKSCILRIQDMFAEHNLRLLRQNCSKLYGIL